MCIDDIGLLKSSLRKKHSNIRNNVNIKDKKSMDDLILSKLLNLTEIKSAKSILTYISFNNEPDTINLINTFLLQNKKVASPVCITEKNKMEFYSFNDVSELSVGSFGILEPLKMRNHMVLASDFDVCIVPGLCFDYRGYRIGYGKGFYDRFLSKYNILKIGVCYSNCIADKLPHDKFDISVDIIVTEKSVNHVT